MKMKKTMFLLALVAVFAACGRKGPDLSRVQEGHYYVSECNGHDVVLLVEDVTKKSFKGRWYVEDGNPAQPHCFEAVADHSHKGELWSPELIVKADAMPNDSTLMLDLLLNGEWQTLNFLPWQQPVVEAIQHNYPFHDCMYHVRCLRDIPYAIAQGYWTSDSTPDGSNDFLSVVLNRMNADDMTLKPCALRMDIYTPITDDTLPRPLLMLIHGGAFFSGDKATEAYVEWGEYFASRGYIVASINYRIGFAPLGKKHLDRAGYCAVQDAYAAMCYLLRRPNQYPIDPDRLFVAGSSAGGITALNLAFMKNNYRPESSYENSVHKANQIPVVRFLIPDSDFFDLCDLGNIDAVASKYGEVPSFKINTVVNMWGAVHDINMIDNENGTAILSFHGDADSVVAYGYDYPFTKVETSSCEFIKTIREAFKGGSSWFALAADEFLEKVEDDIVPINQFMSGKMYGSKCIHDRADSLGMVNELHTKPGGDHSLHVNYDGSLSDYFTLITDTTARFLYLRMYPKPTLDSHLVDGHQWVELDNAGEWQTCLWYAKGGLVLEAEGHQARVIFFAEADEHELILAGQEKNGQIYHETYSIK